MYDLVATMEPSITLWLVMFGFFVATWLGGMVWGYWLGRNSKVAGEINLEPIVRLDPDGSDYREIP